MKRLNLFITFILALSGLIVWPARGDTLRVMVDEYHQELLGNGANFGTYAYPFYRMSEKDRKRAVKMLMNECKLSYLKYYSADYPSEKAQAYDNVAEFFKMAQELYPEVKLQVCVNNLPDRLEKGGETEANKKGEHDPELPDVLEEIADYYFQVIQGFYDRGVTVAQLDVVNERGMKDHVNDLFDVSVSELKRIMADPDKNPDNIPVPEIVGPSTWSAKAPARWIEEIKKDRPEIWENIDVVSTHGYEWGTYENYKEAFEAADGKPFINNEQTGKIQGEKENGDYVDDIAKQFPPDEEKAPDDLGNISIAMRMSDVFNAGGNSFYAFQSVNPSGNNAALLRVNGKEGPSPSLIYHGFKHLSGSYPRGAFRVEHELKGLKRCRVVTVRHPDEDCVYVHVTNVWDREESVRIGLGTSKRKGLGIESATIWITDREKRYEKMGKKTYETPARSMTLNIPGHSIITVKFEFQNEGAATGR